jgi:hypothetical protein
MAVAHSQPILNAGPPSRATGTPGAAAVRGLKLPGAFNQTLSLTPLKSVRQVERWTLLDIPAVRSRAGHHRSPARFFFEPAIGSAPLALRTLAARCKL